MKNILKTIIIPIMFAILIGLVLGFNFYKTYKHNLNDDLRSKRLYLFESGEYDSILKMREANPENNYVYYQSGNKYKTIIAITNSEENISKIKSLYDDNLKITEYYIDSSILDNKQYEYDQELSKAKNSMEIKATINNIIKLYQNDNNLRLISLN